MYLKFLEYLKDPKWKISDISLTSATSDAVMSTIYLPLYLSIPPAITCPSPSRVLQGTFDKWPPSYWLDVALQQQHLHRPIGQGNRAKPAHCTMGWETNYLIQCGWVLSKSYMLPYLKSFFVIDSVRFDCDPKLCEKTGLKNTGSESCWKAESWPTSCKWDWTLNDWNEAPPRVNAWQRQLEHFFSKQPWPQEESCIQAKLKKTQTLNIFLG